MVNELVNVELSVEQLNALLTFLGRVQLSGQEALVFAQLIQLLSSAAQESLAVKDINIPTASQGQVGKREPTSVRVPTK